MKIIFCMVAACLLVFNFSCMTPPTAGGMDNANKEKIKNANDIIYKALESGDVSKIDTSIMAANVIDHGMAPKDVVGIDSIKKSFVMMHSTMKNFKINIISQSIDSVYGMVWSRMTGECTSAEGGMPVGPFDMYSVDVTKWKDGKAVEHWSYMDPRDMMKMMPPPPADAKMHK